MASRRRGFGTVRKLPSGRYQASYVWPPVSGERHNAPTTFVTKADANGWLAIQQTDIARGQWGEPVSPRSTARPTFGEYAERWLALRTGEGLAPNTLASYRRAIRGHLIPKLGALRVDQIKVATVNDWYASYGSRTTAMRAKAYRVLMSIMLSAVAEELITSSPCVIKRGSSDPRRAHHVSVATPEQVDEISAAMPPRWRLMVQLATYCQLRFGELAELRRHDIDLTRGVIKVRRSAAYVDRQIIVGPPKSDAGKRTVSVPPHLRGALAAHIAEHAQAGRNGLLFTSLDDGPLTNSKLHRAWNRARIAGGLPSLHFHDLRHTGATWLAQEGATTRELMRRLGHSTPHMAMRYQHPEDERDAALADRLSRRAGVTPIRSAVSA